MIVDRTHLKLIIEGWYVDEMRRALRKEPDHPAPAGNFNTLVETLYAAIRESGDALDRERILSRRQQIDTEHEGWRARAEREG